MIIWTFTLGSSRAAAGQLRAEKPGGGLGLVTVEDGPVAVCRFGVVRDEEAVEDGDGDFEAAEDGNDAHDEFAR